MSREIPPPVFPLEDEREKGLRVDGATCALPTPSVKVRVKKVKFGFRTIIILSFTVKLRIFYLMHFCNI